MRHDFNHDDDLDDLDDDDSDTNGIVADGQSVRVGVNMLDSMDATQRSIAESRQMDAANHRPGWRVPDRVSDAAEESRNEYVQWLRDAHRTPSVTADAAKSERRPTSLADAQAAAEQARQIRDEWLRNAYKERRP